MLLFFVFLGFDRRRKSKHEALPIFLSSNTTITYVVVSQRVDAFPSALFLGRQVQIGQNLSRGARAPLCREKREEKELTTTDGY